MPLGAAVRWWSWFLLVVLLFSACPAPKNEGTPQLKLRAAAGQVQDASGEVEFVVEAFGADGLAATGTITVTAERGALDGMGTEAQLELTGGQARGRYACDAASDRSCLGPQSIRAKWNSLERTLSLCFRASCALLGKNCDAVSDLCSGQLECGACSYPEMCGALGTSNVCELPPWDRVCSDAGLCWEHPLPHGQRLNQVHGSGPQDVWAGSESGVLFHWDGRRWSAVDAPVEAASWHGIVSLNVEGPRSATAITEDATVLQWDGARWTASGHRPAEILSGAWFTPDGGAWAAPCSSDELTPCSPSELFCPRGAAGRMLHWDGAAWSEVPTPFLHRANLGTVHGFSSDDVWAGGACGALVHWDGTSWTQQPVRSNAGFYGLWGSSSSDLWASTQIGIDSWNGSSWTGVSTDVTWERLWGTGPGDVWGLGVGGDQDGPPVREVPTWIIGHLDGGQWSGVDTGLLWTPYAMWGPSDDLWVVGERGGTARVRDGKWTQLNVQSATRGLGGVCTSGDETLAVGRGLLRSSSVMRRGSNGVWSTLPSDWETNEPATSLERLQAVTCLGSTDFVAVSRYGYLEVFDGRPTVTRTRWYPTATWGSSRSDVFIVGEDETFAGRAIHRDATGWSELPMPVRHSIKAVHGSGPDDVWMVGNSGKITHWDGHTARPVESPTVNDLHGVWATSPTDAWAVGNRATVLRWNGIEWKAVPNPATGGLFTAVTARGPNEAWAVGSGYIMRWDGTEWRRVQSPIHDLVRFVSVVAAPDGTVWFAGETGEILVRRP